MNDLSRKSFTRRKERYDGVCSDIVKQMLKVQKFDLLKSDDFSVFVPITLYLDFIMACQYGDEPVENKPFSIKLINVCRKPIGKLNLVECTRVKEWDYDLQIDDSIYPMKLIWCDKLPEKFKHDKRIKNSFSFLRQNYLRYMDKPFLNPDAITQVNLVLDYHRTQKRRRGIEIFNIFDLIAFKMAIDDNRLIYENCEFHKLIDRALGEIIQCGRHNNGTKLNLNSYMHAVGYYAVKEIVDYLVYHFQKTIGSIYWSELTDTPNKLSSITNVPAYFDRHRLNDTFFSMTITEIDSNGKCAEVLYDLLVSSNEELIFSFKLDSEWIYRGDTGLLSEMSKPLAECEIWINTNNSFHFIENFINWLKLSFGDQCQKIRLEIRNFKNINPYIFNNFLIRHLKIEEVKLDHKLVKMFKKIKWIKAKNYSFWNCRISDDINERFEFIRQESANGQNIFKLLDELENVEIIELVLDEHTYGTLCDYVASEMKEKNLKTFQFKNKIHLTKSFKSFTLQFVRTDVDTDFVQIEAFDVKTNIVRDLYEILIGLEPSYHDEFDFYE